MTAATKGVYITLLCLMYEGERPLGQSWDTLARRCGCTLPAFKRAVEVLVDDGKIDASDGVLWSEKCAKHITQRRERSDSARVSANKRWKKSEQKQGAVDAVALRSECYPEPEPDKIEPKGSIGDLGFSEFWNVWPDKRGKQAAVKAWRKLSLEDRRKAFSAIAAGWFDRWSRGSPGASAIHASSFLNGKRWEDDFSDLPKLKSINGGRDERRHQGQSVNREIANRFACGEIKHDPYQ